VGVVPGNRECIILIVSIGTGNDVLCMSTLEKCVIDALVAKLCIIVCIDLGEKID